MSETEVVPGSAPVAAAQLPGVGTSVHLLLEDGSRPCRVTSADGGTFTVAATADGPDPQVGQDLDVFWAVPRSRIVLPCRLTGIADSQWTLEPTASSRQDERREFARGGALATVELSTGADGEPVRGTLVDISERGLRCWIDHGAVPVAPGDPVTATVWLGTREARLDAVVHSVRELPAQFAGQHLILTFEVEDDTAKLIQQYVLSWEIGERRRKN